MPRSALLALASCPAHALGPTLALCMAASLVRELPAAGGAERQLPEVRFERSAGALEISIGGRPFATYAYADPKTPRPYFAHVRTPSGVQVTRAFPPGPDDPKDHDKMHPGIWLAFGDLGGEDYWRLKARVAHDGFVQEPRGGSGRGSFVVRNRYLTEAGDRALCVEVARYDVLVRPLGWLLVASSEFSSDADFAFGDQEEMGLGVRLATSIAVKSKRGGRILDSEGRRDEAGIWGKSAAWCDYAGVVEGKPAGVTLLPDPANFRPSWYHVRDYGFFVANPFGRNALAGGEKSRVEVKAGERLRLRFGILVHGAEGTEVPADAGGEGSHTDPKAAYEDFLKVLREIDAAPSDLGPSHGNLPGGRSARATDEFVGPLAGWRDVRADYGAKGDGAADDTAAIQRALDDLRFHRDFCVLYFPAGTYRVTETLRTVRRAHTEGMGMTVVGEDPATTAIRWDGREGGTIFQYDAWYSKISRLTLDGAGRARIALAYGDAFSTYNETSDMVFRDVVDGMSMGTADNGQAENAVIRCRFIRCSGAGLRTNNFNSLDVWLWSCLFEDCGWGIYNGAGNFHAIRCKFLRSREMDIGAANLMVFSFIECWSRGSRAFLDWRGGHTWGSPTSIVRNRILDPTGDFAIRLGNSGPYLLADNTIRSREGISAPAVELTWGSQLLVGNTYTVEDPVREAGRSLRIDERVVARSKVPDEEPPLPSTPRRVERPVIEVPPASSSSARGDANAGATAHATAIQDAIDRAAALRAQRPVVHLPMGVHPIDRTLVIPAGSDLRLVGDGAAETATVLRWVGEPGGLALRLEGPSSAEVRDLAIQSGAAGGIRIEGCDGGTGGARLFAHQLNVSGSGDASKARSGVLVRDVANAKVLLACLQGGAFLERWVEVAGGGTPVAVVAGATGTADRQYAVSSGGRLVVRSVYHEMSADAPQGILLDGAGSLSVDATRFSYKTSPTRPLVELRGFQGDFALLTSLLLPVSSPHTARIAIAGDGSRTRALLAGNLFWANERGVDSDRVFAPEASPSARAAFRLSTLNGGADSGLEGGFGFLEDRGTPEGVLGDEAFLLDLLRPLRETRVWLPEDRPAESEKASEGRGIAGVTAVRLHRVIVTSGKGTVGVEIRG